MNERKHSPGVVLERAIQAIEPDDCHRPIVGEQFAKLSCHVVEVLCPLGALRIAVPTLLYGLGGVAIMRVAHVGRRVVEAEGHPCQACRLGQHGRHVPAVRRAGDLVIGPLGIKHAKAVVVLGGEHDVALSRLLSELYPRLRIELNGIEFHVEVGVLSLRNAPLAGNHDGPGGFDTGQRIRPPMDEHAELGVLEPRGPISFRGESSGAYTRRTDWRPPEQTYTNYQQGKSHPDDARAPLLGHRSSSSRPILSRIFGLSSGWRRLQVCGISAASRARKSRNHESSRIEMKRFNIATSDAAYRKRFPRFRGPQALNERPKGR